ncbi:MAG: hypothetical protein ACOYOK_01770 [Pseudobdellovibrionaceae bacterium]
MKNLFVSFAIIIVSIAANSATLRGLKDEHYKDTYILKDLKEGQCTIAVQDVENGYIPNLPLESATKDYGIFFGGRYLSSWAHDDSNRSALVSIEMLGGDLGHIVILVGVVLADRLRADGYDVRKNSQFVVLLDKESQIKNFEERLTYQFINSKTISSVNVPGKSRYDNELKSVPQTVEVKQGVVSFQRTTETGLKVSVSCSL